MAFTAQTMKNLALQYFCRATLSLQYSHAKICYALPTAPPCRFSMVSPEAVLLTKRLHVDSEFGLIFIIAIDVPYGLLAH
jgi:hypothetical protein